MRNELERRLKGASQAEDEIISQMLDELAAERMPDDSEEEAEEGPKTEEAVNDYRVAAKLAMRFFQRGAIFVKGYKGNMSFAFDCWLLAMGWYDIVGVDDEVKLAERYGVTKQNVSKCVKIIQSRLGEGLDRMEPMPGQRTLETCQKFGEVRRGQLE